MESLPSIMIVLESEENKRKNYFNTIIYKKLLKEEITTTEDERLKKSELKEQEDVLTCFICCNYLKNPVNDPTCCPHYACKACFENYFQEKNSSIAPCPICRKMVHQKNLKELPLSRPFEKINDKQNIIKNDDNLFIEKKSKCKEHPEQDAFSYCLECQLKMCEECKVRHRHQEHHLVNYSRFIQLFEFIQNNFSGIKNHISDREDLIKEYKELIVLTEQKKNAYLQCLNDISSQIKSFFNENIEKMNKIIDENMQIIAKLREFMLTVKTHISSQFRRSYDDIENLEDLEDQIKERISKLKLKEIKKKEYDIVKQNSIQKIYIVSSKASKFSFNREQFLDNRFIEWTFNEGIYIFGLELSEDKRVVNAYLDVKKIINGKINNSSYIVFIEYGNKHKILFLESTAIEEDFYSYEKNFNIEELDDIKDDDYEIVLNILSISLNK
jgi:hypothetical protein